jgi:hypothetical protein
MLPRKGDIYRPPEGRGVKGPPNSNLQIAARSPARQELGVYLEPAWTANLVDPAELVANEARGSASHYAMTGNLPNLTAAVLDIAAVRSDQKNDYASRDASDGRAHGSTPGTANERTRARAKCDPSEDIALKLGRCGGPG